METRNTGRDPAEPMDGALARALRRLGGALASDEQIAAWERSREAEVRRELLELSGVSEVLSRDGHDAIVFDRAQQTAAIGFIRQWLASSCPVLALFGRVRTGKTVGAAWALSRMPGRYARADVMTRMRKGDYGRPTDDYQRHLRGELLVVDELGIEDRREEANATLYDVLDVRQRLPRRTLLLGNLDEGDLRRRYDARVLRRLYENGAVRAIGSGER